MIFLKKNLKINAQSTNLNTVEKYYDARYTMVTTVLVVLMILALLEIVLLNGARLFFMIVSAIQTAQDDKYTPHPHPKK